MANIGEKGILRHIDDPSVTVIGADGSSVANMAGQTWVSDADSSDTDFLRAVVAGKGLHYKGVLTTTDNNLIEFASAGLYFTAQEGHCEVEVMVQFEDASEHAFNFGFNDTVEDDNLPIDLSGTAFASTATAFCGFVYDGTDATNKDLHCFWVDDDSDVTTDSNGLVGGETLRMADMKPTDAKWLYLKVELQDRGSGNGARATFLAVDHTGFSMERTFNTSVDRDVPLCWHLAVENRSAVGGDIFLRNCNWSQTIPNM